MLILGIIKCSLKTPNSRFYQIFNASHRVHRLGFQKSLMKGFTEKFEIVDLGTKMTKFCLF